jgi:HAD superfamily hydrolase (TIGR01490 family)
MDRIAAFFDIDGTIYREGLITEVFKKMVTHEIVAPKRWEEEVGPAFHAWDRRQGDYDRYLSKMVAIFKETSVGISHEHIDHIARLVVQQKGDRVYQFTRKEIERHKREGHLVIAISGSPDALVREMANKYAFDDYRGTVYHCDERGFYTGEITPMWDGASKKKALYQLADQYGIDLSQSYSYGDTNGDLTMFENTGHPCAINPTRELLTNISRNAELKQRIRVVVERKDVIYNIDINHLELESSI